MAVGEKAVGQAPSVAPHGRGVGKPSAAAGGGYGVSPWVPYLPYPYLHHVCSVCRRHVVKPMYEAAGAFTVAVLPPLKKLRKLPTHRRLSLPGSLSASAGAGASSKGGASSAATRWSPPCSDVRRRSGRAVVGGTAAGWPADGTHRPPACLLPVAAGGVSPLAAAGGPPRGGGRRGGGARAAALSPHRVRRAAWPPPPLPVTEPRWPIRPRVGGALL